MNYLRRSLMTHFVHHNDKISFFIRVWQNLLLTSTTLNSLSSLDVVPLTCPPPPPAGHVLPVQRRADWHATGGHGPDAARPPLAGLRGPTAAQQQPVRSGLSWERDWDSAGTGAGSETGTGSGTGYGVGLGLGQG